MTYQVIETKSGTAVRSGLSEAAAKLAVRTLTDCTGGNFAVRVQS